MIDNGVLGLLLLPESQRPWSKDELEREVGEDVHDSLNRLYGGGLIHRCGEFVWASRAAVMAADVRV